MNGDAPQGGSPNDAGRTNISHRILVSSLCCLTLSLVKSNPDLSEETKDKITLQILSDAHHPAIGKSLFHFFSLLLVLFVYALFLERFGVRKSIIFLLKSSNISDYSSVSFEKLWRILLALRVFKIKKIPCFVEFTEWAIWGYLTCFLSLNGEI